MNTVTRSSLKRLAGVPAAVLAAAALGFTTPSGADNTLVLSLPSVSTLADTDRTVAADVAAQFRAAFHVPRVRAKRNPPTVEVAAIETVYVEASRLPIELASR